MHLFIHSFNKNVLSAQHIPDPLPGIRDRVTSYGNIAPAVTLSAGWCRDGQISNGSKEHIGGTPEPRFGVRKGILRGREMWKMSTSFTSLCVKQEKVVENVHVCFYEGVREGY